MNIDSKALAELKEFNRRLGLLRLLKGIGYVRSAALPYVLNAPQDRCPLPLRCLDIGTWEFLFQPIC